MLSAFRPQSIIELKPQDKSKVESVIAYGDRILVGLSTGVLRIYRVIEEVVSKKTGIDQVDTPISDSQEPNSKRPHRVVELLSEKEDFSRKSIQQLAVIKESNILISLSDSYVTFHDLQTFEVTERLEKTKGASAFAATSNIVRDVNYEIASIVSRLAVTVKRKIYIWTWEDMELVGAAKELTLVGPIKSLTWATEDKIVAGMDAGFVVINVEKLEVSDIHRQVSEGELGGATATRFGAINSTAMGYVGMSSWIPKPLSTKLTGNQMLLAKDVNSLFIDLEGQPLGKRQIPWHAAPDFISYSYPYLLALQTTAKRGLEIRNPDTLSLLQTISLPAATIIHVPQASTSLAHAGRGFLVASERCIWRMNAVDYDSQLDELIEKSRFDESLSLMGLLEDTLLRDKSGRQRDVKILKAKSLFNRQKYRDAVELFTAAETPPQLVVALYPEEIAGTWSTHRDGDNEVVDDPVEEADQEEQGDSPPTQPAGKKAKDRSKQREDDTVSIISTISSSIGLPSSSQKPNNKLEGKDLTIAVRELQWFLVQSRTRISKYLSQNGELKTSQPQYSEANDSTLQKPEFENLISLDHQNSDENIDWKKQLVDAAVLVDTTLFKAYLFTNPSLVRNLLRLDNFCNPQVVREYLISSERYNELIDFLHTKRRYDEVLELLEKFGKDEEGVHEHSEFHGPRKMVNYLQQLPCEMIDEILHYAKWPMEQDPKLGMQIFLADTENAEQLPRAKVLKFLLNIHKDYALQYLEHVIDELGDETPEFHEQLLSIYLERMRELADSSSEEELGKLDYIQSQLESHLSSSGHYNKTEMLKRLPLDDSRFFESRVIVLRKLSQHTRALQIYVFEMGSYQKAEEYCNQIYLSLHSSGVNAVDPDNPDQAQSVYTSLLSLYLTPPAAKEQNLEAALDLLSRHGSRLPALSTLSILPKSLRVKDLESYFQGRMRHANSFAREEAIVTALSKVEKYDIESIFRFGERIVPPTTEDTLPFSGNNGRVVIHENTLCRICHKRFRRSAVRVWPNGDIVHYGCSPTRR